MEQILIKSKCNQCEKQLNSNEGFISSTGIIVCSEECKKEILKKQKPKLTIYSRVTGYCTPVSSWNEGKIREFKDRYRYKLD